LPGCGATYKFDGYFAAEAFPYPTSEAAARQTVGAVSGVAGLRGGSTLDQRSILMV